MAETGCESLNGNHLEEGMPTSTFEIRRKKLNAIFQHSVASLALQTLYKWANVTGNCHADGHPTTFMRELQTMREEQLED